jgi:DNA-binding response OmpR family regulator
VTNEPQTRVLIADDDQVIRRLLQVSFRIGGFEVDLASGGEECLAKTRASTPDAVVLDIQMPGISGWDVCESLRNDPDTASIPIVLLTARAAEADRARGEALGVLAYLTKPFDPGDLVARVKRALAGAPA